MFKYLRIFCAFLLLLPIPFNEAAAEEILSWQECVKEAAANHPDLISAAESINEQKAGRATTASGLFPQVSADADGSRSKTTSTSSAGKTTSSINNSYSYGVSGTQLIFDGFKTFNDVKGASEDVKAARQGYRFASSEVRTNLRTAFIALLKAQELMRVAEDIVKIRRDNLELIDLRYKSGLEHKGALLTSEANLAAANFELSQAKRDVSLAQRQLTKEMGRREFKMMCVKGDFTVRDTAREKPDFEGLLKNNPSVLQATARKNSAAFGVKSAYGNFAPQISGTAGADRSGSHWPPRNKNWDLGLSVTMPIFEGGLKIAQVAQARAVYKQAEANERSIKDAAAVNLEQTWAALQDAVETVDVRCKSLEASEERAKIAEAQYSTGFIAFDNWIIIENDLVSAKKAYLQARGDALLAEAGWIQAKGEALEYVE